MKTLLRSGRPRRLLTVVPAVLAVALLGACGGSSNGESSSGGDEAVELRFSYMAGENTSIGQLWTWWLDEVEKRSDGSITFERFWDATLLKSTDTIEGLRDGRADVAQVLPTVYAGRFPLSSVGELPFTSSNAPAVADALRELSSSDTPLREEWTSQGVVPLAWSVGASSALATEEPIRTAADLKGKRIRANDRGGKVLGAVGANLINIELADIYGSMERGLIDGIYGIPFSFAGPLKYPEVADHFTDLGIGVSTVNGLAMSQQTWDRLSPEQQRVIEEVNAEAPAKVGEFEAQFDQASCEAVKEADDELFVLPEAESGKIERAGKDAVVDEWKEAVEKAGAAPDEFYESYLSKVAAAEKTYSDFQTGVQRCAGSAS